MGQAILTQKKEIITLLLKQNILLNTEILEKISKQETLTEWLSALKNGTKFEELINKNKIKEEGAIKELSDRKETKGSTSEEIQIMFDYDKPNEKKSIQDFIDYFNNRYKQLNKLLQTRGELQNLTSIARIQGKQDRETTSVIAYVVDKQTTKNDNIILTLEDDTARIKAIVSRQKEDLFNQAKDLIVDEVIGLTGTAGNNVIFVNSITHPDIPVRTELKKAAEEINVAVISDIHLGSDLFLEKEFEKFIKWTRGEQGTEEQKDLAQKTKYIIIAGDLVDGVGVYPGQEDELEIKDITIQYKKIAEHLSQIPKDKKIIIIPGNHDASRLSEPQPKINKKYAKPVYKLPNVISISNPGRIKIKTSNADFDFLIYHGYSYTYYGNTVNSIRKSGKNMSDRTGMIMQFLLKRRHLAPSHSSTLYIPDKEKDELIIEQAPDFFISGHMHKSIVSNYRGVSLVCGSCWQSKTAFQEKMGNEPEPAKVPILNLKTRNTIIIDFAQNE